MKISLRHTAALLPLLCLALSLKAEETAPAQETGSARLTGDIGVGDNLAPTPAHAQSNATAAIPYLNFEYGPAFARIDTFGVKLAPMGDGSVELLTRVLSDGYTPASPQGARHRDASLPLGLGTLQVTPVGAFMANLYRDAGKSGGTLLDLMYAAELDQGPLALYPQAGLEYRSAAYVRYYNGVSPAEATGPAMPAYQPGAANNLFAALFMEAHIGGRWYLNANWRRTWLARSISESPLVRRRTLDSGLVALSYRFP